MAKKIRFDPEALLEARTAKSLTRQVLAKHLGVSDASIHNWESGQVTPVGENLQRVLDFLAGRLAIPKGPPRARLRTSNGGRFKGKVVAPGFDPEDLKTYRKKHGLTQVELSERLSVSWQTIGSWESGRTVPTGINLPSVFSLLRAQAKGSAKKKKAKKK